MIVFLVIIGIALLTTVFVAMPNIPPVPQALLTFADQFHSVIQTSIQFIRYILSPELTFVVLVVVGAIMLAEPAYHGIMWILRKIPALGIK